MDNQTKVIMGLLAIILILAIVFGLKITGIIKPAEKNEVTEESINKIENVITEQESDLDKDEIIIIDYDSEKDTDNNTSMESRLDIATILDWYINFTIKYKIAVFVITIILNIGIAMMYRKIGMPMWTIILQIVSPILSLLNLHKYITLIISIFQLVSVITLFKLLDAFSIELGERKNIFIGASAVIGVIALIVTKFSILGTAMIMTGLFVATLILMFHIKMCFNLAGNFNKGKGFKLGLILLPGIFQAILGYQKN